MPRLDVAEVSGLEHDHSAGIQHPAHRSKLGDRVCEMAEHVAVIDDIERHPVEHLGERAATAVDSE